MALSVPTSVLPFQPATMSTAQLAAVSYLDRCSRAHSRSLRVSAPGVVHLAREPRTRPAAGDPTRSGGSALPPPARGAQADGLLGGHQALHAVRGFFRFAHIDGLRVRRPGRLRQAAPIFTGTQGLDRLELIRFLQVAQTITIHHGALEKIYGINALRASKVWVAEIEDYADTMRGYRVLHVVRKATNPPPYPIRPVPVLRVLEACRGHASTGGRSCDPTPGRRSTAATPTAWLVADREGRRMPRHIDPTRCGAPQSPTPSTPGVPLRDAQILARHADPRTTERAVGPAPAATSTGTGSFIAASCHQHLTLTTSH